MNKEWICVILSIFGISTIQSQVTFTWGHLGVISLTIAAAIFVIVVMPDERVIKK